MADWVGHSLFAATIAMFLKTDKKSIVYLGALLPDFFVKTALLGIFFAVPKDFLDAFFYPTHTILGALILSSLFGIICSRLFNEEVRGTVLLVLIGYCSHLLLDLFNYHFLHIRGAVLFPLLVNFEIPGLLPGEYLWFWIVLVPLYVLCRIIFLWTRRSSLSTNQLSS